MGMMTELTLSLAATDDKTRVTFQIENIKIIALGWHKPSANTSVWVAGGGRVYKFEYGSEF